MTVALVAAIPGSGVEDMTAQKRSRAPGESRSGVALRRVFHYGDSGTRSFLLSSGRNCVLESSRRKLRIDLVFSFFVGAPEFGNRERVTAFRDFVSCTRLQLKRFLLPFSQKFFFTKSFVSEYDALRLYAVCMSGNELF